MALLTKPNMQQVWASGGDIVEPSDLKKQQGWTVEVPPHQFENWIQNRQDEYLAHINQRGIPAWDGLTNYEAGGLSYVQGSDGKVYKSVAASGPATTTQDPTTDVSDTYWTVAFADVGAFLTQAAGDTRYTQRSNNLSDLTNIATARANLGAAPIVSPAFTGTPTAVTASPGTNTTQVATTAFVAAAEKLNAPIATVAAAGTINLTTGAPNTSQIAISGTGVTITGFTVAAGRCYFVRFAGALTLTNGASLVTQTGANIRTAAGDTCIIRATASNVVEVMVYVDATAQSLTGNGYRKFKDGMIIQWGNLQISSAGTAVSFPIVFPTGVLLKPVIGAENTVTSPTIELSQYEVGTVTASGFTGISTITANYSYIVIGH